LNEVRNLSSMTNPRIYIGDMNERQWIINNLNNWRWDTLNTNDRTQVSIFGQKVDWVLGESDSTVSRLASSYTGSAGAPGFESDHKLLTAFLRVT
jgi:hypothetical protein